MAKSKTFIPDYKGYREVMGGAKMQAILATKNADVCARANRLQGSGGFENFQWTTRVGVRSYGTKGTNTNKALTKAFNAQKWD